MSPTDIGHYNEEFGDDEKPECLERTRKRETGGGDSWEVESLWHTAQPATELHSHRPNPVGAMQEEQAILSYCLKAPNS